MLHCWLTALISRKKESLKLEGRESWPRCCRADHQVRWTIMVAMIVTSSVIEADWTFGLLSYC